MIGTKLAHYEITSHLGSGGMGDVYQATDSKLGRNVAIKVLPEGLTHDAERSARFEREARVLAALNHPHIAGIYGLEESGDRKFLVMELVEGETLADRIKRGPIPVEDALQIAKQICEALEGAHERGIIHRDLKPANVKITPDGKVKVLDFGLAKAFEAEGSKANLSQSPTLSMAATNAGIILGTAAYMSPEQAKGLQADARSDAFSFGCVFYELLTGRQAFQGETVSEILASVLVREPDFALLPLDLNPRLYELLQRCLDKNPKRRWHCVNDLRLELETVASDPRRKLEGAPKAAVIARARIPRLWVTLAAVLLLAASALFAVLIQGYRSPRESPAVRFLIPSPDKTTFDLAGAAGANGLIAPNAGNISPDGRKIVFIARDEVGKTMLWVRALDVITAHPLPGTENASLPFWSPDSKSIGFFGAFGKLRKVDVEGGPVQTICDAPNGRGGTWNREGVIVFAPNNPSTALLRVSASGGEPSPVTKLLSGEIDHRLPWFLPDGKHFLYWTQGTGENSSLVFVGSLDSLQAQRVLAADSAAIYALPGYLLFIRQGTLLAQPFDAKKLELTGEAVPIAEQVAFDGNNRGFSVSENGTLNYRVGIGTPKLQLVWVDRTGKVIESAGVPALYQSPAISPDGKRIAVHRHEGTGGDLWLVEVSGNKTSRLTFDASQENSQPIWSADGSRIVFGSRRNGKWGIYQKLSNSTGNEELLFESDVLKMPMSWSAAANTVLFWVQDPKNGGDVWSLPLAGDRKPRPVLQTAFSETHPQISPDGKWFAYNSNETGRVEIYVQTFPPGGGKWQISNNGGDFARWRPDGKELFYMETPNFGKIVGVAIHAASSTFDFSTPRPLFDSAYFNIAGGHTGTWNTFDVSSDGQRFLIPRPEAANATAALASTPITVVLNWTAALH